jgi:hypothetical protein
VRGQGPEDQCSQPGQAQGSWHAICTARNARPTDAPCCACVASKEARTPLWRCRSTRELGARRRRPPQEGGTTDAAWAVPSWFKLIKKG